jgi:hypothetical protein
MFRALLARPQEALHKRHLVYCVRVMSVGCTKIGVKLVSDSSFTGYSVAFKLIIALFLSTPRFPEILQADVLYVSHRHICIHVYSQTV